MSCISKWIKNSVHFFRNCRITRPNITGWNHEIFCKCTVSINSYTFCIFTVLLMSLQTVTTLTASDMSFTRHQIPRFKSLYACSNFYNFSYIFMSCCKSNRNCMLCPFIPLPDMYVCSADCCFVNLNLNIIRSYLGNRDTFHPQSLFWFLFYKRPHHTIIHFFSHDIPTSHFLPHCRFLFSL